MIPEYRENFVFFFFLSGDFFFSVTGILDYVQFSLSDQGNSSLLLTLLVVISHSVMNSFHSLISLPPALLSFHPSFDKLLTRASTVIVQNE